MTKVDAHKQKALTVKQESFFGNASLWWRL